jgi:tryptophan synthase alpha chain
MKTLTKHLCNKKQAGETIITPYIMAGDHEKGLDGLEETISFLTDCGAAAIELGIPFSDPVADGEVIQRAGLRALAKGVTLQKIIEKLQKMETDGNHSQIPLVIMSYFNPIYNIGVEKIIAQLKNTNVKGLIIPDLPFEHEEMILPFLRDTDIALVRLISLTTPKERQKMLAENAEGFIYAVALNGTTGVRNSEAKNDNSSHFKFLTENSKIPVLAGFGVSSKEQIENYKKVCDGAVVGSFIVNALHNGEYEKVKGLFGK